MQLKEKVIIPNDELMSGGVKQYTLSRGRKITQITTFCPDIIGPGPTHLYLIDDGFLTLVDTGIPTHLAKKLFISWRDLKMAAKVDQLPHNHSQLELERGLAAVGYSIKDIELIIVTHGHLDHFLMGSTIVEKSGAKVAAHVRDTERICNPWAVSRSVFEGRPRYKAMGMRLPIGTAEEYHQEILHETSNLSLKVDLPISRDGELSINGYQSSFITVKHSPGHSPGSISLIIGDKEDQEKIMLCGDVMLYPITPHPDDLLTYLRTIDDLGQLKDIAICLPGHGEPFYDLLGRTEFLKKHHRDRLDHTYRLSREPKTVWEIASEPGYFDVAIDPENYNPMAGHEAYIHIKLLEIVRGVSQVKIDKGVYFYQNSGEPFDQVYSRICQLIDDRRITII